MSNKNKAPKLYVVEKKTPSGKTWSKKLVAVPGKVGDYRVRRLAVEGDYLRPTKVLAVRSYAAPEVSSESVNNALARLNASVNA